MKNKRSNISLFIICSVIIGTMQSCSLFSGAKKKTSETIVDTHEQNGFVKAIVINYAVDGCTFMLQPGDDAQEVLTGKVEKKLQPVNLREDFKKDNLKVWIKYQHFKGNSICMVGEMVTITAIEKR